MSSPRLTLLHTADIQAAAFEQRLANRDLAATHDVRADFLQRAGRSGLDAELCQDVDQWLRKARQASDAVLCTCSTLGPRVDALNDPAVIRIDRPLMRAAVASGDPLLLSWCLDSTAAASRALLEDEAQQAGRDVNADELHCADAWPAFEGGDMPEYFRRIARAVNNQLETSDANTTVILAQASMADAAPYINARLVLSAPELALDALASTAGPAGEQG